MPNATAYESQGFAAWTSEEIAPIMDRDARIVAHIAAVFIRCRNGLFRKY